LTNFHQHPEGVQEAAPKGSKAQLAIDSAGHFNLTKPAGAF
jgi:hypothetical protein